MEGGEREWRDAIKHQRRLREGRGERRERGPMADHRLSHSRPFGVEGIQGLNTWPGAKRDLRRDRDNNRLENEKAFAIQSLFQLFILPGQMEGFRDNIL